MKLRVYGDFNVAFPQCGILLCAIVFAALHESACSAPQARRPLLAPAPDSPIAVAGAPGSVVIGDVMENSSSCYGGQ